jgi:phosphonate transport system substrate-binding protein
MVYRVLLVFFLTLPLSTLGAGTALRFGLFPNLSPRVLLEVNQPMATYLSHRLGRAVYLETAPDFASFARRTRERRYDLLLTAPHLAYLANAETGYRPLFAYASSAQGMLVVPKNSSYRSIKDLRGTRLAFADPLAVVTMMMEKDLARAGLQEGRDYQRINAGSHNNAALLAVQGKADGAIIGVLSFQNMSEDIKQSLRPLAYTQPILGLVYLASPNLTQAEIKAVKTAIADFITTAEGRAFLNKGNVGGLVPVDVKQLSSYQSFGNEARHRMEHMR